MAMLDSTSRKAQEEAKMMLAGERTRAKRAALLTKRATVAEREHDVMMRGRQRKRARVQPLCLWR